MLTEYYGPMIAMPMLEGEVLYLETVNQELKDQFNLGEYAGALYE